MPAKVGEYRKVPGAKAREYLVRAEKALAKTTVGSDLVLSDRGEGARLWDVDGNEYLDFGGVGTTNFGFGSCLAPMRKAIFDVLSHGIAHYPTPDWHNEWSVRGAEELLSRVPLSGEGVVFPTRSGTEAVEAALKALRKARPERDVFIRFRGGFHGRTHGSLSLLDPRKPERVTHYAMPYQALELPFPAKHHETPFEQIKQALFSIPYSLFPRLNGLFVEVVQGEGGINVADSRSLVRIADFCREHDIALVIDEIQAGMGRTGKLWAYEHYDIQPDIVLAGKSLGGGVVDVSAAVIRKDLSFQNISEHASTFGLEPIKAAAMVSAFEHLDREKLAAGSGAPGDWAIGRLGELLGEHPNIKNIRGKGLMIAIEFRHSHDDSKPYPELRNQTIKEAEQLGIIALACGFNDVNPSVRLMPPLVISHSELDQGLGLFRQALERAVAPSHAWLRRV